MHAVVDHRPRALEISAFTESDREDLLPHFAVCCNFSFSVHGVAYFYPVTCLCLIQFNLEILFRNDSIT